MLRSSARLGLLCLPRRPEGTGAKASCVGLIDHEAVIKKAKMMGGAGVERYDESMAHVAIVLAVPPT